MLVVVDLGPRRERAQLLGGEFVQRQAGRERLHLRVAGALEHVQLDVGLADRRPGHDRAMVAEHEDAAVGPERVGHRLALVGVRFLQAVELLGRGDPPVEHQRALLDHPRARVLEHRHRDDRRAVDVEDAARVGPGGVDGVVDPVGDPGRAFGVEAGADVEQRGRRDLGPVGVGGRHQHPLGILGMGEREVVPRPLAQPVADGEPVGGRQIDAGIAHVL